MKFYLTIAIWSISLFSFSQPKVHGVVENEKGEPIFAANVYLKSGVQNGVTSNFDGAFRLDILHLEDTIIVSFLGYETKEIPISDIDISEPITVILKRKSQTLDEVIITAKDPISEQFSVVKMTMLKDVYLNPISQGDPIKAITMLPASTNSDETANPSLRGSSPDRSRVMLNGVPIYNPVRASQLNNQGFFSLFNPEVISKQYVYASNPPLTYGNTSAGLVEIQTKRTLEANQLQLSTSLASAGLFLSQKINKDISFVQVYGNYQFSDAFVAIQKDKLPNIKKFYTKDAGLNFHTKMGKRGEFNSYTYYIDESFDGYGQSFGYSGAVSTLNKRLFTVNNFKYYLPTGIFTINSGTSNSKQSFAFGNIKSDQQTSQIYTSIDYKRYLLENTKLQLGVSHDYHRHTFYDSIPTYYYALSSTSPHYFSKTSIRNHNLEAYLYANWDINDKFTLSSGMRSNVPLNNQQYYLSTQLGLKYRLDNQQSFLLSGGKYHNYSIPSYYSKKHNLLSSYQVALDYSFETKNTLLKAATYYKSEDGEQPVNAFFETDKVNTVGIELFFEYNFYKYLTFALSNSFIDQKISINHRDYKGAKDFNYFLKSTIQYNNPMLFSLALTYTSRPGIYYTEVIGSRYDTQTHFYEPIFSNNLYNAQFGSYHRFDMSLSKYITLKKSAIIAFVSLNNLLNTQNERAALYSKDYAIRYVDFYQFRTLYFGLVWQIND